MSNWTGTYFDGDQQVSQSVQADDLNTATTEFIRGIPEGGSFVSLALDETPKVTTPSVVQSPNGTAWTITVADDGTVQATPATNSPNGSQSTAIQ